jgi:hypothetical protein
MGTSGRPTLSSGPAYLQAAEDSEKGETLKLIVRIGRFDVGQFIRSNARKTNRDI